MSLKPLLLTTSLLDYYQKIGYRESDALRTLREHVATFPEGQMQTGPEVVQLLAFLIRISNARNILELGTFGGYSALGMAEALPRDGKIITCDIDAHTGAIAQQFWQQFGCADTIELRLGNALDTLTQLKKKGHIFDFIYIDADKKPYGQYYEEGLEILKPGGIMAFDNTLRLGQVADPSLSSPSLESLRALNEKMHTDPRVFSLLLPFSDGLTLAIKN